jgi:hypothetical protein
MAENKGIGVLLNDFLAGGLGEGAVLFHKRMHKEGSGEFACVRGILENCVNPVSCPECFHSKSGSACLRDGQSNQGFLVVEEKHRKLVEVGASGAYASVAAAIDHL